MDEFGALATRSNDREPMVPSYQGGKFPLSTYLAARVREMLSDPAQWKALPPQVKGWLSLQRFRSVVPKANQMLVETFPRADKHYMVCYPFEGRLAHQTLGMLLTRRLERAGHAAPGLRRLRICAGDLDGARPVAADLRGPHLARRACSTRT